MSTEPQSSTPIPSGVGELLLAGAVGLVAVVLLAAEAAGAALSGGHFVSVETATAALVHAVRGAHTVAWQNGHLLPRIGFLVLAFVFAGLAGAVVAVVAVHLGRRGESGGLAPRALVAQTASPAAARRAVRVTRPSLDAKRADASELGYPLGVSCAPPGIALVASWEYSLQVVAPPGAGKTTRVLAPILRQHPGPALATSTKSDLYELCVAARRARGPVVALDPERLCPAAEPLRWSPVGGCRDPQVAERRASALVAAAGDGADVRGGGFFRRSATTVLAAYLHAAALSGGSMGDVLAWARRPSDPAPLRLLASAGEAASHWAGRLEAHTSGAEETTSGVMRTVDLALGCFADPGVEAVCAVPEHDAVQISHLLEANGTVFALGKDRGALGGAGPLITALCDEVVVEAERLAARQATRRLDPPLLACLDEAPSIAPLPNLPALLADGRGRGITTVIAMQSFSQAAQRWGRDGAATIRDAASILLVFGGLAVAADLEELSKLTGTRLVERRSWSQAPEGRRSESAQFVEVPVLDPAAIHALEPGVALCCWGSLPPMLTRLPAVFEGRAGRAVIVEEAAARGANDDARRALSLLAPPNAAKERER